MTEDLFAVYAQSTDATAAASSPSVIEMLILPAALFLLMYIVLIRPQARKIREQKAFLEALKTGQKVLISGSIIGTVHKITPSAITVHIGCGKVDVLAEQLTAYTPRAQNTEKNSTPQDLPPADKTSSTTKTKTSAATQTQES